MDDTPKIKEYKTVIFVITSCNADVCFSHEFGIFIILSASSLLSLTFISDLSNTLIQSLKFLKKCPEQWKAQWRNKRQFLLFQADGTGLCSAGKVGVKVVQNRLFAQCSFWSALFFVTAGQEGMISVGHLELF